MLAPRFNRLRRSPVPAIDAARIDSTPRIARQHPGRSTRRRRHPPRRASSIRARSTISPPQRRVRGRPPPASPPPACGSAPGRPSGRRPPAADAASRPSAPSNAWPCRCAARSRSVGSSTCCKASSESSATGVGAATPAERAVSAPGSAGSRKPAVAPAADARARPAWRQRSHAIDPCHPPGSFFPPRPAARHILPSHAACQAQEIRAPRHGTALALAAVRCQRPHTDRQILIEPFTVRAFPPVLLCACCSCSRAMAPAAAQVRIKDIADVEGVRDQPVDRLRPGGRAERHRRQAEQQHLHPRIPGRHAGAARRQHPRPDRQPAPPRTSPR